MVLYQTMHRKGLIEPEDDEDVLYKLTERGVELVKFINSLDVRRSVSGHTAIVERSTEEDTRIREASSTSKENIVSTRSEIPTEVSDWIQSWIDLFPSTKIEGRYLRTNKNECADRMRWFLKEYKFDKETIFKATKAYLQSQEASADGHRFTRNSSYFIFKGRTKFDRTSDLATWCQRVVEEGFEERETWNRDIA